MDLPFNPKFFKKLELYRRMQDEDRRSSLGNDAIWPLEKAFLEWAHEKHFHLGGWLSVQHVFDRLRERNDLTKECSDEELREKARIVMCNLEEHGFGIRFRSPEKSRAYYDTRLTSDGMLMGEVITEILDGKQYKYFWERILSWTVFVVAMLALVMSILKPIYDIAFKTDNPIPITVTSKKSRVLQSQINSLQSTLQNMNVAVKSEPSGDVSKGLFLGRIKNIDSETSNPNFVIDLVSANMMPGLTKEQRERSSWPDYFGWNKINHSQQFSLNDSAELVTGGLRFQFVSLKGFVHEWNTYPDSEDLVYYIAIHDQEIVALWPWLP